MDPEWREALITAGTWGPPTVLGIRALVRGPIRFRGRVVTKWQNALIAAVWLSPLPAAILVTILRLMKRDKDPAAAVRLALEFANLLRYLGVVTLFIGGAMFLALARPEPKPERGSSPRRRGNRKKLPRVERGGGGVHNDRTTALAARGRATGADRGKDSSLPEGPSMRLAFSTNAYMRFPFEEAAARIAAFGYEGLELMADVPHAWPAGLLEGPEARDPRGDGAERAGVLERQCVHDERHHRPPPALLVPVVHRARRRTTAGSGSTTPGAP